MASLTESEVMGVVAELTAKGEKLSLNRIRELLGHGSYSTIKNILRANGIETTRTSLADNNEELRDPLFIAILHDLKEKIIKTRLNCELLEEQLTITKHTKFIENLLLRETLIKIIVMHLTTNNPLRTFCYDSGISNIIGNNHQEYTSNLIAQMKNMILDDLLNFAQTVNSAEFVGGNDSLEAMQRMLKDLKNRNNGNVQAYRY